MFQSIQSFRAIAALMVVGYHLSIGLADPRYFGVAAFSGVTWRLNIGVDFFFVLSGFIIMMAHQGDIGQPARFANFLIKRFRRIYPIYWIYVGAFCLLLAIGFGTAATRPANLFQWFTTFSLVRLDNFKLPISPAWTLIHEVAFYSAFALMILSRRLGIFAFVIWQVACLSLFMFPGDTERTVVATYLGAINIEFSLGIAAYLAFKRGIKMPAAVVAMGVAILAAMMIWESTQGSLYFSQLFYGAGFALIIAGAAGMESQGVVIRSKLLVALGDASYTIYLTHIALLGLVLKGLLKVLPAGQLAAYIAFPITFVVVVAVGAGLYRIVEHPMLTAIGRRSAKAAPVLA